LTRTSSQVSDLCPEKPERRDQTQVEVIMAMSASEARKLLFPLIEKVNDDQEAMEIVSKAGTAFLVPEAQWHSLMETQYLLRSPANAKALLESIEQLRTGNVIVKTFDELTPEAAHPEPDMA
jgi:antitoxin YefM